MPNRVRLARELRPDGSYSRRAPRDGEDLFNAQEYFLSQIKQSDPAVEGVPRPKRAGKTRVRGAK